MKTQLTIAAAVLTLAACTPKFYPPQVATPESYVYGAGFSSDTTGVGERWWELFGDTTLDALVEQALANNRYGHVAVVLQRPLHEVVEHRVPEQPPPVGGERRGVPREAFAVEVAVGHVDLGRVETGCAGRAGECED